MTQLSWFLLIAGGFFASVGLFVFVGSQMLGPEPEEDE
jgi:hypothetical protein